MIYRRVGKRTVDVVLSLAACVILLPLFAVVAVLIRVFDPGPVFFSQDRVGRGGATFRFHKFRSLPVSTADVPSDELGALELPWIGRFIRRTNIDELPQLYNILKGDMSVVGPRPPLPRQQRLIELRRQNGALECRPGLTGLAQINSFDGMSVEAKAELDGLYAQDMSFMADLRIIAGTFGYLLKPPPVY